MKRELTKNTLCKVGVVGLSNLKSILFLTILFQIQSNVFCSAVSISGEITGIINSIRGQIELSGDISKYTRSITTKYGGIKIEQTWQAEQGRKSGDWRYLYTCESPQFTDKKSITSIKPFEISENGSRYGDVPLEVRNFSCTYNYPQEGGGYQVYSFDNQTEFQVKVVSKYNFTPWLGGNKERVAVLLLNWTPERRNCDPIMGFPNTYQSFGGEVPVNGFGYITVRSYKFNGNFINLSSGDGAGFGVSN